MINIATGDRPERPKRNSKKQPEPVAESPVEVSVPSEADVERQLSEVASYTVADKQNQVLTWIIEGRSNHAILKTFAAAWPEDDPKPYLVAAMDALYAACKIDIQELDGWILLSLKDLYSKAAAIGDFAGAARMLKEIRLVAHSLEQEDD